MRFFSHTTAEYTCTKHCGYHRSVKGADLSLFHVIAAATATIPLWVLSLREDFPWYYFVSILAGELLLVLLAGIATNFLHALLMAHGTSVCRKCGAPMFSAGRHYDPLGSTRPHWSDIVIFVVFVALNIAVWVALVRGDI